MKKLIVSLVFLFLIVPYLSYGADKADRNIDFGMVIVTDPLAHQAIYEVLKAKGISSEGLETTKEGYIRIIKASSDTAITPAEVQAEIDKIKAEKDVEVLIQKEMRKLAIVNLKKDGKLSQGYIDKVK